MTFYLQYPYEILFPLEWQHNVKKSDVILNISDLGWFDSYWVSDYLLRVAPN